MFDATADIPQGEIKAYRSFGYQLYLEHDDSDVSLRVWNPDKATPTQIRVYRTCMLSGDFLGPCHSSESTSTTEFKTDGFNEFDPTYDALMFNPQFDGPESRGDLSMNTNHFSPAGTDQMDSLPLLPMPASTTALGRILYLAH
ncbi:hypothetical protein B0H14DRAFT_2622997 [Mycena olivaceomarginata]|nr:hypothetical protein B0H14DRAFT_2622997 [Mycena olivaceomarginata]